MNRNAIENAFVITVLVLVVSVIFYRSSAIYNPYQKPNKCQSEQIDKPIETTHEISAFDIFVLALIEVESENDAQAVGKADDAGILQITPIFLQEANRVQGERVYELDDRFSIQRSLEMFYDINNFHNPDLDIDKAIKIHNPKASSYYKRKILKKIKEIEKRESVRNAVVTFNNQRL